MMPSIFQKPFDRAAFTKSLKNPYLCVLLFVLVLHFALTFTALYNRYVSFEMWEPVDSSAYMQISWSIVHGSPFTTSIQERWVSYAQHNFLGDQLIFTLSLFSPLLIRDLTLLIRDSISPEPACIEAASFSLSCWFLILNCWCLRWLSS